MLPAYVAAFAFGVVLIGTSILLGGKDLEADSDGPEFDKDLEFDKELDFDTDLDGDLDADVDADLDADLDGDLDADGHIEVDKDLALTAGGAADALIFNPFLSLRFWTYFLATGGGVGTLLTLFDISTVVHLPTSILTGFGIGYGAAWAFRTLKKNTVRTQTNVKRLAGREGEAVLRIAPGRTGKVRLTMGGSEVELMATTRDGELERGAKVLVVSVENGVAEVIRMPLLADATPEEKARARRHAAAMARKKQS